MEDVMAITLIIISSFVLLVDDITKFTFLLGSLLVLGAQFLGTLK